MNCFKDRYYTTIGFGSVLKCKWYQMKPTLYFDRGAGTWRRWEDSLCMIQLVSLFGSIDTYERISEKEAFIEIL